VTSLVAVPIGSRDAGFIFQQIARDFQALTIQGHVTYRVSEPQKAASMLNFTLKADGKTYESDDPEKLTQRILGTVEVLAQQAVKELTLKEALRASDRIADIIATGLKSRADIASLGLEILGVSIRGVSLRPTPPRRLRRRRAKQSSRTPTRRSSPGAILPWSRNAPSARANSTPKSPSSRRSARSARPRWMPKRALWRSRMNCGKPA